MPNLLRTACLVAVLALGLAPSASALETRLVEQDTVLAQIKQQQSKWMGAIAVIVAVPGVFAIVWQLIKR